MKTFAVQYLEDSADIWSLNAQSVRRKLIAAFDRLPITQVLIGWNVPPLLLDTCVDVCAHYGAKLFRWHPLLTGERGFTPCRDWQTIGLNGEPVRGFRGMPEFTFMCPNHPDVQTWMREKLDRAITEIRYDGVFLDRIRFSSPTTDLANTLACFCVECRKSAAEEDLDLDETRIRIKRLLAEKPFIWAVIKILLQSRECKTEALMNEDLNYLVRFLDFRCRSVTRLLEIIYSDLKAKKIAVGLDCFSPVLTYMVGQNLGALNNCCDWIKIMIYAHAFGPAGLPYEFIELANWMVRKMEINSEPILFELSRITSMSFPKNLEEMKQTGFSSRIVGSEINRAQEGGAHKLLVGLELVEIEGVTRLDDSEIQIGLKEAINRSVEGVVLSWDLWHIPVERLDIVRRICL